MTQQSHPVHIHYIPVEIPLQRIYARLGFRRASTKLTEKDREKIDAVLHEGQISCQLSGVYVRKKLQRKEQTRVFLENGICWDSQKLANFLSASGDVFILGATAGQAIVDLRDRYLQKEKTYQAVIIDAFASEMVESAVQWIHDYVYGLLKKEFKRLTKRRYSPGYGDFSLKNQQSIVSLLDLEKIGVQLNDHYLLLPEKSVTAVVGILSS